MKKKMTLKLVLDGFIQGVICYVLGTFAISVWSEKFSIGHYFIIDLICSVIFSFVYYLIVRKCTNSEKLFRFSSIGFVSFLVSLVAGFIYHLFFSFRMFPLREGNAGNGLEILFTIIGFVVFSFIARFVVLLLLLIRNKKHKG